MASGGWVVELDKKEHKNWVMVGCALNIAKKGIVPTIQNKMETWYQSLISSPPLQSLPSCACAPSAPKCATCVIWEKELKRHHKSGRPKICWDNSDRTQWGSPTGAWEIAKVYMPTLGSRAKDVIDADRTDIGGLLNLLEWCPFINPPVSRTLLNSARDECRNRWAHAAKQEICDADVQTILSHLNNLLSDPVFNSELSAQKASSDLQDLSRQGLINVRESEVEALHLLRQCLEADLRKCQEDLAYTLRHLSQVQEQSNENKSEITTLKQQMGEESKNLSETVSTILIEVAAFNKFLNQRDDLRNTIEVICDDLDELSNGIQKVVLELNEVGLILPQLESNLKNLYCEVQKVAKNFSTNKSSISRLQEDVMEVKEEMETLKHKTQVEVKLRLLKQQHATALSLEAQHRLSTHTTWVMNFEYVKKRSPAAAKIMRISAFFESEYIPFNVINRGSPECNQEEQRECSFSYSDIGDILKILSSYSLFSVNHQCKLFRVHKLVQQVVRDSLTKSERIKTLVECVRVLRFAFLQFSVFENFRSGDLYEMDLEDQLIVFSLLLHFLKLTSYMKEEMNETNEDDTGDLFNVDTYDLCKLVHDLTRTRRSLYLLNAELSDFFLQLFRMVFGDSDPSELLFEMTNVSSIKCNTQGKDEGKKLMDNVMQKLFEFEKSGVVIEANIKFQVLYQMANFFFVEGEVKKCYNALLDLESLNLPISAANTAELQMCIAVVENFGMIRKTSHRAMKAVELAKKIYSSDDPKLLRMLQYAGTILYDSGKLKESKIYAKEMRDISMTLPPWSDDIGCGMHSPLSYFCELNHEVMKDVLLEILEYRCPHIYSCILDGYVNNCIPYLDDGFEDFIDVYLHCLMKCVCIALRESNNSKFSAETLAIYRRIGETFVSLRMKHYGSIFPDMEEARCFLMTVNILSRTDEEDVFRSRQLPVFVSCQGRPEQCQCRPCADSIGDRSRRYKDAGNAFFSLGDYLRSLEFYNKALNLTPKDAKLLTNKASAQVKLSKQKAQSQPLKEQQNILQHALQDSLSAISADPSWVKGYYWKAVCLAELGQRGASLAAAAVAECLFPLQWTQIPAVVEHFGRYIVKDVATSEDLGRAVEIRENSLVIVVRSGKYVLTQPLKVPSNAVIVGLGKVEITCVKGVPLFLDKTVYIDNIELTPSAEFIRMNKEDAKKCLDRGQLDQALSLYSKVLASCPENTQLLTARASTYLKAAKEKSNTCERESLLELGLEDTKSTIRADPSCLLGYSTRAAIMTELGRKHEALASAAVFNHLSSGRDISSVIQRYGALQIHVVENSDELRNFLEEIEE
ncbi:unnamed protein product [Porites lobata]|uniref:DUF7779 domain-containing protein n=1 Tax=Porites lobata TaxID=104759 RepID=A0ABN8MY75_9CNID|nr:unnamed protein product [Porites lobata]